MDNINLFRYYSQAENRYTNGLICLLNADSIVDNSLLRNFFNYLVGVNLLGDISFKVLRDYDSSADTEILSKNSIILLETKITSGTLKKEQIKRHLLALNKYKQRNKKLVLLTPDSIGSNYIKQYLKIAPNKIIHINWNSVISFLKEYKSINPLFSELIQDYVKEIKEKIFEQDISSGIVKISFGNKSEVYPESYLEDFKNGKWSDWHTPKKYKELDGKGKRLILYDKNKGLVLEVEIEKVRKVPNRHAYPWSNKFVKDSLIIYKKPIPLKIIKRIPDIVHKFSNFDKCQTPYWKLTREQYSWLHSKLENGK